MTRNTIGADITQKTTSMIIEGDTPKVKLHKI